MLRRILLVSAAWRCLSIAWTRPRAELPKPSRRPLILAANAPTFSDNFSGGTLDATKWFIDSGTRSGKYCGGNTRDAQREARRSFHGHVAADVDSETFLERSRPRWERRFARSSCSATEPTCGWRERLRPRLRRAAPGSAATGSVTDVFNFINDSESEIDFEYQGQSPATLEMTNYSQRLQEPEHDSVPVAGADSGFHEYKYIWSAVEDRVLC